MTATNFKLCEQAAPNNCVTAAVTYSEATKTATLDPTSVLANSKTYTATVKGGSSGVTDLAGNPLAVDFTWSFTTVATPDQVAPPSQPPSGPILVVTSAANPFTRYYAEILRAEGLNAFDLRDISTVTAATLSAYDVVILGAMRPDSDLAGPLGLTPAGGTLSNAYLKVDTASGPGTGIVGETIQFHGTADRYTLSGASAIATLYSNATTSTSNPAVGGGSLGPPGGPVLRRKDAAFTLT